MCEKQKTIMDALQTVEVLLYVQHAHAKKIDADLVYLIQVTYSNQLSL